MIVERFTNAKQSGLITPLCKIILNMSKIDFMLARLQRIGLTVVG